ncbi:hypothetical protein HDZ31DRAFT_47327 [Schizophyllum fasciatum]
MSVRSDNDSLFGSPPSSPAASARSLSPELALPSASNVVNIPGAGEDQNVGTIALPGSHNFSELPAAPLASSLSPAPRPPAQDHGWDAQAATPANAGVQPAPHIAQQPATAAPQATRGAKRTRRVPSPGRASVSRKRRRRDSPRPVQPRIAAGDAPSRPIVVEDQPHLDPRLPVPTTAEIVQTLMNTKEVLPLLLRTLLLVARSPLVATAAESSSQSGSATPSERPRRRRIGPSLRDVPPPAKDTSTNKKRKLTKVPAGAQDWDVPFPFQAGEGPEDYQQKWEKQRTRRLIGQLINLIKAAAKKTAVRKYRSMKMDGLLPDEDEAPRPTKRSRKPRKAACDPPPAPVDAQAAPPAAPSLDGNGSLDQLLTSLLSHGGSGVSAGVFGADGLFDSPSGTPAPTDCDDFTSLIQSSFPSVGFDYNALWMNAGMTVDANGVPLDSNGMPIDSGASVAIDPGAPVQELSFEELSALFATDDQLGLGLDGLGLDNYGAAGILGTSTSGGMPSTHDFSFPIDPALLAMGQGPSVPNISATGALPLADASLLAAPSPTPVPSMSMSASASSAGDGPHTPALDQEQPAPLPYSPAVSGATGTAQETTTLHDGLSSLLHTILVHGAQAATGLPPHVGTGPPIANVAAPDIDRGAWLALFSAMLEAHAPFLARQNVFAASVGDGVQAGDRTQVRGGAPAAVNPNMNMDVDWTGMGASVDVVDVRAVGTDRARHVGEDLALPTLAWQGSSAPSAHAQQPSVHNTAQRQFSHTLGSSSSTDTITPQPPTFPVVDLLASPASFDQAPPLRALEPAGATLSERQKGKQRAVPVAAPQVHDAPANAKDAGDSAGVVRMPVTAADRERVLRQARERKAELEAAIERAKVELWELSIEGDVLHRVRAKLGRGQGR